jgi:hypothetical protein
MMALYRAIAKAGKWEEFERYMAYEIDDYKNYRHPESFTAWLFCLSGSDYEGRCEMVAEFLKKNRNIEKMNKL